MADAKEVQEAVELAKALDPAVGGLEWHPRPGTAMDSDPAPGVICADYDGIVRILADEVERFRERYEFECTECGTWVAKRVGSDQVWIPRRKGASGSILLLHPPACEKCKEVVNARRVEEYYIAIGDTADGEAHG